MIEPDAQTLPKQV